VLKKGEHGAMLFSKSGMMVVPAYPLDDVKDPTGAGTCLPAFHGRLAGRGQTDRTSIRLALAYGSVVASFGVEHSAWTGCAA